MTHRPLATEASQRCSNADANCRVSPAGRRWSVALFSLLLAASALAYTVRPVQTVAVIDLEFWAQAEPLMGWGLCQLYGGFERMAEVYGIPYHDEGSLATNCAAWAITGWTTYSNRYSGRLAGVWINSTCNLGIDNPQAAIDALLAAHHVPPEMVTVDCDVPDAATWLEQRGFQKLEEAQNAQD